MSNKKITVNEDQKKIQISAKGQWSCPKCGEREMDFEFGNGGNEQSSTKINGLELLYYTCTCKVCGEKLYSTYLFAGNLTKEQFLALGGEETETDFIKNEK